MTWKKEGGYKQANSGRPWWHGEREVWENSLISQCNLNMSLLFSLGEGMVRGCQVVFIKYSSISFNKTFTAHRKNVALQDFTAWILLSPLPCFSPCYDMSHKRLELFWMSPCPQSSSLHPYFSGLIKTSSRNSSSRIKKFTSLCPPCYSSSSGLLILTIIQKLSYIPGKHLPAYWMPLGGTPIIHFISKTLKNLTRNPNLTEITPECRIPPGHPSP